MSKDLAAAAKTRGNEAFTKGEFQKAVEEFTEAIKQDPTDGIFYSNRSGAFASLKQFEQALEDANKCLELRPDFVKGYSRKGVALFGMGKHKEAEEAYDAGLKLDPANAQLKDGLSESRRAQMDFSNPFGKLFGADMFVKLQADPTTRGYLSDPAYLAKMQALQKNPDLMNQYIQDPKVSASLGVLLGIGTQAFSAASEASKSPSNSTTTSSGVEVEDDDEEEEFRAAPKPAAARPPPAEPKVERKEPPKKEVSPADQEKELGNAAYLKKQFDVALIHYNKALELDPKSIVYYNNIAAVQFEQKEFEKAIETCNKGIEVGRDNAAHFKDIAKAFFRLGNIYAAQHRLDDAIEAYNKSQVEDYSDKTKSALKKIEQLKKVEDAKAYINPEKSEEHKLKGNEFFAAGKWIDAIAEYSEALKRNPDNYKVYSNRAACYTKLMDWTRGLEDCEKCLSYDSKFVKAYIRKGKIQHFLKQYHKALETFNQGLEIDPSASELLEAKRETMIKIQTSAGDPERAKEAMKDPEIQNILRDPSINQVLQDMQQNPGSAQAALSDPTIKAKIEKLIAAGVLSVR